MFELYLQWLKSAPGHRMANWQNGKDINYKVQGSNAGPGCELHMSPVVISGYRVVIMNMNMNWLRLY